MINKDYYLEFEELSIVSDARLKELATDLREGKHYSQSPLIDFISGEFTSWDEHESDLCKLSGKFPEFEFTLTIVDKQNIHSKCFNGGEKLGEFDSALMRKFGMMRLYQDDWYVIPFELLDKFEQVRIAKTWNPLFDFYKVDPEKVKAVCN